MNRRESILALTASFLVPARTLAELSCTLPNPYNGSQICQAGINSELAYVAASSVGGQHQSEWCWAASISMVFAYYDMDVPQEEIVRQAWGTIVNQPGQPLQILQSLNRNWVDANGQTFKAVGNVISANPVTAAQDLSNNMPLIIGTLGHAMVLTALTYIRFPNGSGQVTQAIVRDPWPGQGVRVLTPQEWYSTSFLARIRVNNS